MSIALICQQWDPAPWLEALLAADPELDIQVYPDIRAPENVEFALCWKHPAGSLAQFPNLKAVSSLGAGVDHLFNDPEFPVAMPVCRVVDPDLTQGMFEYVLTGVLYFQKHFQQFASQQQSRRWQRIISPYCRDYRVAVLGLGVLGGYCAQHLAGLGYGVSGWSQSQKELAGVECYAGVENLGAAVADADVVVCLLPLTEQTRGILATPLFAKMQPGACLINVARGQHLNEVDLLQALDSGQLGGALLDVFEIEPLPENHLFWHHPQITITPHCSSVTNPKSAAAQLVDNYRRLRSGRPLLNQVDWQRGY